MRVPATLGSAILLFTIGLISFAMASYSPQNHSIRSLGKINYMQYNIVTKFYSGRDYPFFHHNYIPYDPYFYVHTQWFASLTPTGELIPRHETTNGWGNTGVNWRGVEKMTQRIVDDFGGYPIIRIWLMNLDKSDQEWNTQNRGRRGKAGAISISDAQPKISYEAIEIFLLHLNNLAESLGLEHMIFIPCWEFNQVGCSELRNQGDICWGQDVAGSWRDWDINPSDYETFMTILIQARDTVAPRIRIGVAPDGMAGKISWTSENPNWDDAWTRQWGGRDGFYYWLDGFRECNFSFDAFGVSQYPRLDADDPLQNSSVLIQDFLGEQWNRRIVELVGLEGKTFILYEFNCLASGGTANENFITNVYNAVIRSIDQNIVRYESICWYMGFSGDGMSICNFLAEEYHGYPLEG